MDAAQAFIQNEYDFAIDDFVVAGGSKRGWTTWLTAAVDDRVKAIMPASIEIHDIVSQMRHHHAGYGFFAPATVDYVEANLVCQLESDGTDTLLELIDPNTYKERYTMPKLLLNSAGDQFFASDSARFYYSGLPSPKQLRMSPNTDHGQNVETLTAGLQWLLDAVSGESPGRDIDWVTDPDGTLRVTTSGGEQEVLLWQASNPEARHPCRQRRVRGAGRHSGIRLDRAADRSPLRYADAARLRRIHGGLHHRGPGVARHASIRALRLQPAARPRHGPLVGPADRRSGYGPEPSQQRCHIRSLVPV
jgi:PhoPQ-activated pathogenicity-related protein